MKLELKHIVGYLPYGLKMTRNDKNFGILYALYNKYNKAELEFEFGNDRYDIEDLKPALRPMTDLVKEINGVVHAIELAKIKMEHNPLSCPMVDKNGEIMLECRLITKPFGKVVKVTNFDTWVLYLSLSHPERLFTYLTNYLYENHFDIHNLIGQDLAIDINTL